MNIYIASFNNRVMRAIFWLLLVLCFVSCVSQAPDWKTLSDAFGRGQVKDGIFKASFPRYDLDVKIGEVPVAPDLAFTSWAGFEPTASGMMTMGDFVLLEKEVAPVVQILISGGFEVTGIHNHLIGETPHVMYVHFHREGSAKELADALVEALHKTATPWNASPQVSTKTNWSKVNEVFGVEGQGSGGVIKYSFPRAEPIWEDGIQIPPSMGVATAINFQNLGDKAATTGDFVLKAEEVNLVIKTLSENGITVTAVHNHLMQESPKLFFLHFWAVGDPEALAKGLEKALDEIK